MNKIYFICPWFKTGGPESIHQVCNEFNKQGIDSYIFYYDKNDNGTDILYPEYSLIKRARNIDDNCNNFIVIPEAMSLFEINIKNATICLFWLSYTNSIILGNHFINNINFCNTCGKNVIHWFQSYFSYISVRPFLRDQTNLYFVNDYINIDYKPYNPNRKNKICYNGKKDIITPLICKSLDDVELVRIDGMDKQSVINILKECKIYIDNGYHPGKDRLPREAAIYGCVVITNKCGSAAYMEDVYIDEKVTDDEECKKMVKDVLNDYHTYYIKQEKYRMIIQNEYNTLQQRVNKFIQNVVHNIR